MATSAHENLTRSTANYVKSNQTQNFTTNLSINCNIHDAEKLLFTHTPGSMNRFRQTTFYYMAIEFILQRYAGKAATRSWRHFHWSIISKKTCKSLKCIKYSMAASTHKNLTRSTANYVKSKPNTKIYYGLKH